MISRHPEAGLTGSKGAPGTFHKIINEIPPHRVLIEPFAGTAAIARIIRPADEIILIDRVKQPGLRLDLAPLNQARFIQGDGIAFLNTYKFKGDEFVYGDPPYVLRALLQRGRAYYVHGWADPEHRRWLRVAKAINCRVAISGYHSPLYDDELSDWRRIEFEVMTRGGTKALEVLWMNYPKPTTLHDWAFVGDDFRARCRLRRKIRRAVADLAGMPPLERGAMFAALAAAMKTAREDSAAAHAEKGAAAGTAALAPQLVNAGD